MKYGGITKPGTSGGQRLGKKVWSLGSLLPWGRLPILEDTFTNPKENTEVEWCFNSLTSLVKQSVRSRNYQKCV